MSVQKTAKRLKRASFGQSHHKADLTDHEVDLMRELHEVDGWGYRRLAAKFEISRQTVRSIVTYRTRTRVA